MVHVNLALRKTMCDYKVEVVFLIKPYVLYFRTAVFLWIPRVLNQSEDFGMFKLHIYMSMNVWIFMAPSFHMLLYLTSFFRWMDTYILYVKNKFQSCNFLCTLMQDIIIYYDLYCLDLLICQDPLKYYSIILMDQMLCWTYLHLELNSSLMVVFNCLVKICFLLLF